MSSTHDQQPHGIFHFTGSFDADRGQWTIHGVPGPVGFGPDEKWASAEIQVCVGGGQHDGDWRAQGMAFNSPPLGGPAPHVELSDQQTIRDGIVANARWGVAHEPDIHYAQTRPIAGLGHPRMLPLSTDCSGFATDCFKWAGAPDPNGRNYDGSGFTGTMLDACVHISPAQAKPGDLIVFGSGTGTHVVIVVGTGSDPDVVSHGQERGPLLLPLSQEKAFHAGEALTFLSAMGRVHLHSDPVPTDATNAPTEEGLVAEPIMG
jgi:hypothetical protein